MQRRQVGFIKTYTRPSSPPFQPEPSEFSYFKLRPHEDQEFSPYKFQEDEEQPQMKQTLNINKKNRARPPLPQRSLEKAQTVGNLADRVKAEQLQQKIRKRVAGFEEKKSASSQKLDTNIGNIRNKIDMLDEVLRDLKDRRDPQNQQRVQNIEKISKKFEEDNWSSSSSSSEEGQEKVVVKAIPQQDLSREDIKDAVISPPKEEQDSSQEEEEQIEYQHRHEVEHISGRFSSSNNQSPPIHQQNVITFNSRLKDQPPLQIQQYPSSSESDLEEQTEQDEEEEDSMEPVVTAARYPKPHHQAPPKKGNQSGQFHKNKGGVCFDVDVKQFTAPLPKEEKPFPVQKKKQKPEEIRAQMLIRRQAAKAYDRRARRAVFSPSY